MDAVEERLDLTELVGYHYSLLAALTDKDAERASDVLESLADEVEDVYVGCDVIISTYEAVTGDKRKLETQLSHSGDRTLEVQRKIKDLRRRVDQSRIAEEDIAKYDALIDDLSTGKSIPDLLAEIELQKKKTAKQH